MAGIYPDFLCMILQQKTWVNGFSSISVLHFQLLLQVKTHPSSPRITHPPKGKVGNIPEWVWINFNSHAKKKGRMKRHGQKHRNLQPETNIGRSFLSRIHTWIPCGSHEVQLSWGHERNPLDTEIPFQYTDCIIRSYLLHLTCSKLLLTTEGLYYDIIQSVGCLETL